MARGTAIRFDESKGFGLITPFFSTFKTVSSLNLSIDFFRQMQGFGFIETESMGLAMLSPVKCNFDYGRVPNLIFAHKATMKQAWIKNLFFVI